MSNVINQKSRGFHLNNDIKPGKFHTPLTKYFSLFKGLINNLFISMSKDSESRQNKAKVDI